MIDQRLAVIPSTSLLLDAVLAKRNAERVHVNSGRINAGDVGRCPWATVAKIQGLEPLSGPDAKAYRLFELGNRVEDMVRDAHKWAGTLIASQVHVIHDDLNVSGYMDLVVGGQSHGLTFPPTVIEVKSASSMSMKMKVERNQGASFDHMMQLATYRVIRDQGGRICLDHKSDGWLTPEGSLRGDGFEFWHAVEGWEVTYIGRDYVGELDFPLIDKDCETALERIAYLNRCLAGEEPRCECDTLYNGAGARYCQFAQWQGGVRPDNWRKLVPPCCGREAA